MEFTPLSDPADRIHVNLRGNAKNNNKLCRFRIDFGSASTSRPMGGTFSYI